LVITERRIKEKGPKGERAHICSAMKMPSHSAAAGKREGN